MKILITGGLGYIGSTLAIELLQQGHYVSIVDNAVNHSLREYDEAKRELLKYRQVEIIPVSIEHLSERLMIGMDLIIHLAAITDIKTCEEKPNDCFHTNYELTKLLITKMKNAGVNNLIFASTAAVYGLRTHCSEIYELHEAEQINNYGLSKYKAEKEIIKSGLNFKILRFSNVYGTGLVPKNNVIQIFKKQVMNNEKLTLHGTGTQYRDFIHLQDLISAITLLMNPNNSEFKGVFNIGFGKSVTIKTVANKILNRQRGRIIYVPSDREQTGTKKYFYDTEKIMKLGWKPRINLDNGLKL